MIVSGGQQRDSAIYIRVSILPATPLLSRLPHNIEQFPVLYSRTLLVIHFNIAVHVTTISFVRLLGNNMVICVTSQS